MARVLSWHYDQPSVELHQPKLAELQRIDPRYLDANPGTGSYHHTFKDWQNRETCLPPVR